MPILRVLLEDEEQPEGVDGLLGDLLHDVVGGAAVLLEVLEVLAGDLAVLRQAVESLLDVVGVRDSL